MEPTNADLLQSHESLQKLFEQDLKGVFALRLEEIVDEVNDRLQKLNKVEQDLSRRVQEEDLTQEEANAQWREVRDETAEINEEPMPRSALREVQISAADLKALKWMIEAGQNTEDDTATE